MTTTAVIRLLESCIEEARETARRGYGKQVAYLRILEEDAPGLISRAPENWLSLRTETQFLDATGERMAIEYLLLTASRLLPLFNAALADQVVNVDRSPRSSFPGAAFSEGGWAQQALFEIESLEREAAKPLKPLAQWEILFRAARLCQFVISNCLNRLAEKTVQ